MVSIILLLLIVIGLVRLPSVQQKIVSKAESYLEETLGTTVSIGHLYLSFPKALDVREVYLEDEQGDTLAYFDELNVDTDLWALMDRTIELNSVTLTGLVSNVTRSGPDSSFNFSFIPEAFASSDTTTSTGKPWDFNLEEVSLENIRIRYQDELTKTNLALDLKELSLDLNGSDVMNNRFHLADLTLSDARIRYVMTGSEPASANKDTSPGPDTTALPDIQLDHLQISNSVLYYETPEQVVDLQIGTFELEPGTLNLAANRFEIKTLLVENTRAMLSLDLPEEASTPADTSAIPTAVPELSLDQLTLTNLSVDYTNRSVDSLARGFDPNHISIRELNADITDITYGAEAAAASIRSLTLKDPNGLNLEEVSGTLEMDSSRFMIDGLHLQTEKSEINMDAESTFTSLAEWMSPNTTVNLHLENTFVSPADLLYFNPQLNDSLPADLSIMEPLQITAEMNGSLENLIIETLRLEAFKTTYLSVHGSVMHATDPASLAFDLNKLELVSSWQDIAGILPDSLHPSGISMPEKFEIKGAVSGMTNDLEGSLTLTTSQGKFDLAGEYSLGADSIPSYNLDLKTGGYDLAALLNQPDQFGQLALDLSVKGKGTSIDTIDTDLDGTVIRFDFQGYTYNNLKLNGNLKNGFFTGQMNLEDENLAFTFDGEVDQNNGEKHYKANLEIELADLQALNFSQTPLTIGALIEADIKTRDFRHFNGDLGIRQFSANNGIDTYHVDSLIYTSISQQDKTEIDLKSDLIDGYFRGNIDIFSLPETLVNHFNQYYTLRDTVIESASVPQQFAFSLDLKTTDLITEILVPEMDELEPGTIEGSYDSESMELLLDLNINRITYGGFEIDSILVFAETGPQKFEAGVRIGQVESTNLSIDQLTLLADVEEDVFKTRLSILDSANANKYIARGIFQSTDSVYRFELEPDTLMLAYELWQVREGNYLEFYQSGFYAHDFVLTQAAQTVSLETVKDNTHRMTFDQFNLKTISNALGGEELLTGLVNGTLNLETGEEAVGFTADLDILDIRYLEQDFGSIALNAGKTGETRFQIDLIVSGENQLELNGAYLTASPEASTFELNIRKFNLKTIEALASESFNELTGTLSGELEISGAFTAPTLNGSLNLSETIINPAILNILLKAEDETITVDDSEFAFRNFTLRDKDGHTAVLNGEVGMKNLLLYELDLAFKADDFLVMNTDSDDSDLYYGKLLLDCEADITGTSIRPNIEAQLEVKEGSNVSYIIPESEYTTLDRSNIVYFKPPAGEDSLKMKTEQLDSVAESFQGISLSANLEVSNEAIFNIIIDPITRDQLTVQGDANINTTINRKGDIQLSGRYEITSGTYNFSFYNIVKREFTIEGGSSITWNGDPLEADLDIRASYTVETSAMELLSSQLPTPQSAEYNQYRQQLPFLVYLNIEESLTQPEITFELDMPMNVRNAFGGSVYARLQDINSRESDLNKQVFALLILQRFISDNPFSSEGGSSLEDNTRRSVSRIMSDQLNRMTEGVKGIELDFNLQSYEQYSTEGTQGRTDLELGLSKNLFNDRVVVRVSGNVHLEGGEAQRTPTDYIGDLVIEYKLTEDGRIRVTGFRRNEFDVIGGEIQETGTGVIYVREYDAFKELFQSDETK